VLCPVRRRGRRALQLSPRRPLAPQGQDISQAWSKALKDDDRARRHASQSSATGAINCSPPIREEMMISKITRACNPPILEPIKGGGGPLPKGRTLQDTRTHTRAHSPRYWHLPQSSLAHIETWELLSISRPSLYPLLQAPRCKIIQCSPHLLDVRPHRLEPG